MQGHAHPIIGEQGVVERGQHVHQHKGPDLLSDQNLREKSPETFLDFYKSPRVIPYEKVTKTWENIPCLIPTFGEEY